MKALSRLFGELVAWRWAPAVGLCVASLFYVLVVVALVPNEIGVPMTNARFTHKLATPPAETAEAPTFPNSMPETEAPPPPSPAPVQPAGVVDFGRRGFSPPLDRPEPPPMPVMPPPAPPPVAEAPAPPPEQPAVAAAPQEAPVAEAAAPPPVAPTGPPFSPANVMRSMQAIRGGMFPGGRGAPGAPGAPGQNPAPTPPGQQPSPEAPPAPAPGR